MKCQQVVLVLAVISVSIIARGVNAQSEQNRVQNTLTGADRCLDIVRDGKNNRVTMAQCGNVAGQRWSLVASETNPQAYRLQTPFTGTNLCLGTSNDRQDNRVRMAACNNTPRQLWSIAPSKVNPNYSGYYQLRNMQTGENNCLEIISDGRNNRLRMAKCRNVPGQSWRITQAQ
jgi:Ricin-type beta-trefoil lectin domain